MFEVIQGRSNINTHACYLCSDDHARKRENCKLMPFE